MQEIVNGLEAAASTARDEESSVPEPWDKLQAAAEKWAVYALRNHRAPLLAPALAISSAISEYLTALLADPGSSRP